MEGVSGGAEDAVRRVVDDLACEIANQRVALAVVAFHVRAGPVTECVVPAAGHGVEQELKTKVPFLALPDRSDASDVGFNYFVLKQTPELVVGVSCYRQVVHDQAARNKAQRALCVLCNVPAFDMLHRMLDANADTILWVDSNEERIEKLEHLLSQIRSALGYSFPPRILGTGSLESALRYLGGGKPALGILRCILLGNTGVIITGPSGTVVSTIVLALASVLPGYGGFFGSIQGLEEVEKDSQGSPLFSTRSVTSVALSMHGNDAGAWSKMIVKPYCSLMDLDDLQFVYEPRKVQQQGVAATATNALQGRFGFFAGAVNPIIASQIKKGLGDLLVALDDVILDENWQEDQQKPVARETAGTQPPPSSSLLPTPPAPPLQTQKAEKETQEEEEEEDDENPFSSSTRNFSANLNMFSQKAAQFMKTKTDDLANKIKDKTGEMVHTIKRWAATPVVMTPLSEAGEQALDLGKKDREFYKRIDKLLYKKQSTPPATPERREIVADAESGESAATLPGAFSGLLNSFLNYPQQNKASKDNNAEQVASKKDNHAAAVVGSSKTAEQIDAELRKILAEWLNSLFDEMDRFVRERVLSNLKLRRGFSSSGHSKAYLLEWTRRTRPAVNKSSSEIIQFSNGDEFRGELIFSDPENGFVDVFQQGSELAGHQGALRFVRHGVGVYVSSKWRYEGSWRDDVPSGHACVTPVEEPDLFIFDGEYLAGKRCGKGTCVVKGKGQYSGDFKDDNFHGRGLLFDSRGSSYLGNFQNGQRHGSSGCFKASNGGYYDGEWENGLPRGMGNAVFSDKSEYYGNWKDGQKHGQGLWKSSEKTAWYQGEWMRDKRHGEGTCVCTSPKGSGELIEIEGTWSHDVPINNVQIRNHLNQQVLFSGPVKDYFEAEEPYRQPIPVLDPAMTCSFVDFALHFQPLETKDGSIQSIEQAWANDQNETDVDDDDE